MNMSNEAYGLYLNYCKGFKVTENDFAYAGASSPAANSFGIIVNQSNPNRTCGQGDEIYKNTFHSILVGGRAQGRNSEQDANQPGGNSLCYPNATGTPNNVGLVFKCNTFYNNVDHSDLSVTNSGSVKGNIAFQQGYASFTDTTAARNTFSHTSGSTDFFSAVYPTLVDGIVNYTHHTDVPRTPLTYTQPPVILNPCNTCGTFTTTSCPTKIAPTTIIKLRTKMNDLQAEIDVIKATLAEGDAQQLLDLVATGTSGQIKNGLLAKSPYLSDRVLIAAVNKQLAPGIIKEIILPNSPVTAPVMEAINAVPLPNGIRNEINNAQTGTSERTKLVGKMSYFIGERSNEVNELLRLYLNDTTIINGIDSVIEVLKTENIDEAKCDLTRAYLTKGDVLKATETVDELRTNPKMDNFCKMADVLIQLYGSTAKCYGLSFNPVAREKVEEVALEVESRECADANGWLKLAFDLAFQEIIEPVTFASSNLRMANEQATQIAPVMPGKLYPNPNNGTMLFEYSLADGEKGELAIYDITGRMVNTFILEPNNTTLQISEAGLKDGIYFYHYVVNGKTVTADKLVIIK
jgi:hypothetical protein